MHIRHETVVYGDTLASIQAAATEVWREFIADPEAELPWNAELNIEETERMGTIDGSVTRRHYSAQVRVTTESQPAHTAPPPSTA